MKFWTAVVFTLLNIGFVALAQATTTPIRIGYYGGTFDPPTLGHRSLIERAIKAGHLDVVIVMPSLSNTHKPNASSYELRKQMVALNFAGLPIHTPDHEMERAFAQDRATGALRVLMARFPHAQILRITGDDVISRNFNPELSNDKAFEKIGYIVGERAGPNRELSENLSQFDFTGRELILIPASSDQGISSTQVKEKLTAASKNSVPSLHPDVLEFIRDHGLYHAARFCRSLYRVAN